MKTRNTLLAALVGILGTTAHGQVQLTVTGSTAFRANVLNRVPTLYDTGSLTSYTNSASAGTISYIGTISNKVSALGATTVTIALAFSGSGTGMTAVKNQAAIGVTDPSNPTGALINKVPDVAFSDVYPGAASPPIPDSAFDRSIVGVVPFVYCKNNALAGISNITREQAVLLMTASGDFGMPATYLGGASPNPVYLIGRDSGSGSRISVEKDIAFSGTPLLWATNGVGGLITTNGYSSGSLVRAVVASVPSAIGYLGLADFNVITNTATALTFQGVPYTPANVANGSYGLWGYEHVVNRVGGLSANQILVRNALLASIQDTTYQSTDPGYTNNFVAVQNMKVERGTDGGPITSLNF